MSKLCGKDIENFTHILDVYEMIAQMDYERRLYDACLNFSSKYGYELDEK